MRLLGTIALAAPLVLLGCGTNTKVVSDDGATTDASAGGGTAGGTAGSDAATTTGGTTGTGGDTTGGGTATGGTTTGGTTTGGTTTGGTTGGTGDKACAGAKEPTGKGVPFPGVEVSKNGTNYNFTCTMCPGGDAGLKIEGKYRLYNPNGEPPDVTNPPPSEYRETITFAGNQITGRIFDPKSDNVDATYEGFYFCGNPDEKGKLPDYYNTFFVYTKVEPKGAYGITAGTVDPCFLGVSSTLGAQDILIDCNFEWDAQSTQKSAFCKTGQTVYGKPCEDPFN